METLAIRTGISRALALFLLIAGIVPVVPSQEPPPAAFGIGLDRWEYVPHGFYALGWGQEGQFAFATFKNFSEASGPMIEVVVVIQDMVTDEQTARLPLVEQRNAEPDFGDAWARFGDRIVSFLDEHGVVYDPVRLTPFPFTHGEFSFVADVRMDEMQELQPGEEEFGTIDSYEIWVTRTDRDGTRAAANAGSKRITRGAWDGSVGGFLAVATAGHFPSPNEPRTAVLVVETIRGWEGPPHDLRYRVAGSHLERGF